MIKSVYRTYLTGTINTKTCNSDTSIVGRVTLANYTPGAYPFEGCFSATYFLRKKKQISLFVGKGLFPYQERSRYRLDCQGF